jgi:hypothetical protein
VAIATPCPAQVRPSHLVGLNDKRQKYANIQLMY